MLIHSFVFRSKSLQESALFGSDLRHQIHALINELKPDIVVFDTIRTAQFSVPENFGGRVIVYLEDLFSRRYLAMLSAADITPGAIRGVIGNFASFLPQRISALVDRSIWIKRNLLTFESNLTQNSEMREANRASACLLLNHDECKQLQGRAQHGNVITIKPLMEIVNPPPRTFNVNNDPTFVFLGTLSIPQNAIAIERFIETCWKLVLQENPKSVLRIIGGGTPSSILRSQVSQHGNSIELAGFVQDLSAELSRCCAMVVPLLFGSGVKLKIIEALAHGVPIVSTPVGIDGVFIEPGKQCLVAQELQEFPKLMSSLLDPITNEYYSAASREAYESEYAPSIVTAEYARIFAHK